MSEDSRARAYFDARARPFDRLYDRREGLRGRFDAWAFGGLRSTLERTLAELADLSGKHVLDVGCGPGRYSVPAAELGATVVGIDLSPHMLTLARRRAHDRGVSDRCRFVQVGFDEYQPDARFEVVLMISVLEYRQDVRRDLTRLHELATEKAIVTVPPPRVWQTTVRRVRHRLRPSPPSFHVHSPTVVATGLAAAGFDSWRADRGWFVAYKRAEEAKTARSS